MSFYYYRERLKLKPLGNGLSTEVNRFRVRLKFVSRLFVRISLYNWSPKFSRNHKKIRRFHPKFSFFTHLDIFHYLSFFKLCFYCALSMLCLLLTEFKIQWSRLINGRTHETCTSKGCNVPLQPVLITTVQAGVVMRFSKPKKPK